jgi:hypothetical protein
VRQLDRSHPPAGRARAEGEAKGLIFWFIVFALWLCDNLCTLGVIDGPDRPRARVPKAAFR